MKILAFFGGARKKGNTMAMLDYLLENLEGEKEIVNCYDLSVSPCIDCKYCFSHRACSIKDGMTEIYKKIDEADMIIFATPTYFFGIPGPMKSLIDRFQMYWSGVKRGDKPEKITKIGAYLMSGGSPSFKNQFIGGGLELSEALRVTNTRITGKVLMSDADKVTDLNQRPEIKNEIKKLVDLLNCGLQ